MTPQARQYNSIGIDFGTTNTVLAASSGNAVEVLQLHHDGQAMEAFRTALAFQRSKIHEPHCEAGPAAIDMFINAPEDTRFLQSFKSFAASAAFTDTTIFAKRFRFEDLLAKFVSRITTHAGLTQMPKRLVIGRPVTFAGNNPKEDVARQRYDAAFMSLGIEEVFYVLEPVAAAFFYAQRLQQTATVLVGDFGGGTSDFSIMRFGVDGKAHALGHSGVGVAGDTFDYRIIDAVVSSQLGKHATYRSWDKQLEIPAHYFTSFSRWNELCLMNRPTVLRELRQFAADSDQATALEGFIDVIEGGMSYGLYQAIAKAKAELSTRDSVEFNFNVSKVSINKTITRQDFEYWIADDLQCIDASVEQVLNKTNLAAKQIDRVFLTGGTSHVPAVRQLFTKRFGKARIETGDQLISIAKGLALIGNSQDSSKWAAQW